jgi:hypothetical protein
MPSVHGSFTTTHLNIDSRVGGYAILSCGTYACEWRGWWSRAVQIAPGAANGARLEVKQLVQKIVDDASVFVQKDRPRLRKDAPEAR